MQTVKTLTIWNLIIKMNKKLKILHVNIQSINNETKTILLQQLINISEPDIISLNETFLKPNKALKIAGYQIYRSDRLVRKGGGAALCIKNTLNGSMIDLTYKLVHENGVGFQLDLKNNKKISIFSLYSSPSTRINPDIFDFINKNHDNSIIIGDLNSKNTMWYCAKTDPKGEILENILNSYDLHILNSPDYTFIRGKSVLDLSICSNSVRNFFFTLTKFSTSKSATNKLL